MNNNKQNDQEINQMEIIIGKIMRIGVMISALIMLIGYALLLFTNSTGYPGDTFPLTLTAIWEGILQFKPYALMMGGIFLLILTPALRVITSIYTFFKSHDTLYTVITTIVLIILLISFFLGHAESFK